MLANGNDVIIKHYKVAIHRNLFLNVKLIKCGYNRLIIISLAVLISISSAVAQTLIPKLPAERYNYSSPDLPDHFLERDVVRADTMPRTNQTTNAGATLGRVLFYDTKLSVNNTISCASCHLQEIGFSDPARLSVGFAGANTGRHSMGLANARYYDPDLFFWDERVDGLESQVLLPIQDPTEMGMDLEQLTVKLASSSYYSELFEDAFGSSDITSSRISRALAQFVRSMISYRSKYDVGVTNGFANFTTQEEIGRQLFNSNQTQCSNCHETDLQILDQARNTGLDAVTIDPGAGNATFKSPSLRNIAIRPPYMHDGRFTTLAEVVEFYNSGIQGHPNLDNRLQQRNGQPRRMNLDVTERAALVAFLETLTDNELLEDEKFSDPFVRLTNNLITPIMLLLDDEKPE